MADNKNEVMLVYRQSDISALVNIINSMTFTGIDSARQIATMGTLLETGKLLEESEKCKDGEK